MRRPSDLGRGAEGRLAMLVGDGGVAAPMGVEGLAVDDHEARAGHELADVQPGPAGPHQDGVARLAPDSPDFPRAHRRGRQGEAEAGISQHHSGHLGSTLPAASVLICSHYVLMGTGVESERAGVDGLWIIRP